MAATESSTRSSNTGPVPTATADSDGTVPAVAPLLYWFAKSITASCTRSHKVLLVSTSHGSMPSTRHPAKRSSGLALGMYR